MKSTVLSNHFLDVLPARLTTEVPCDLAFGLDLEVQAGNLNQELEVFAFDFVPLKYELERVSVFSLLPNGHQEVDS